jgi:hypothetical protein
VLSALAEEAQTWDVFMIQPGQAEAQGAQVRGFDELSHECEIKSVDRVAGKVVIRIPKEGGVGDHECWQACVPEGGVVTHARFRQEPSIEGHEKRLGWQILVLAETPQNGTSEAERAPVSDNANEVPLGRISRPTGEIWIMLAVCRVADHLQDDRAEHTVTVALAASRENSAALMTRQIGWWFLKCESREEYRRL